MSKVERGNHGNISAVPKKNKGAIMNTNLGPGRSGLGLYKKRNVLAALFSFRAYGLFGRIPTLPMPRALLKKGGNHGN